MSYNRRERPSVETYVEGILKGDRILLSRAITLIESELHDDNQLANQVIAKIMPHTGNSIRLGITGVPGVGKSTFIETFGNKVTENNKKLAVLAIDPSSKMSGGSILGDKTRMETLSRNKNAFIRPSSARSALGGVAHKSRESILLCEAAGFEFIVIETVGVGQSEIAVHEMVDFFLLLMLAGAGDELQGIKKGIMEMADGIAITKADNDNIKRADQAKREYQNALHLFPPRISGWIPKVLTCSALQDNGVVELIELIQHFEIQMKGNGHWLENRSNQNIAWMHDCIDNQLRRDFFHHNDIAPLMEDLTAKVREGNIPPPVAASQLINLYKQ